MLNINKILDGSALTITLEGRMDTASSARLDADLRSSLGGVTSLVMDLAGLEYISSAGLRVLLRIRKTHPDMRITGVNSEVYEILDMTGFTDMLTVEKAFRRLSLDGCELIARGGNGVVKHMMEQVDRLPVREG